MTDKVLENAGAERVARAPAFSWKSFSRFVEVHTVATGWLVLWGRYEDAGRRRRLIGNRIYPELAGVGRRVAEAALELTHDAELADEALTLFHRADLPPHRPAPLPAPL